MSFRVAAVAVLGILAGTHDAGATAPRVQRIDLTQPDGEGIEDLPGIRGDEIEALRAVCGPGPEDLGERLAASGLPEDRLQEWAPYLDARDEPSAARRCDVRATWASGAATPVRSGVRVRSCAPRLRADLGWQPRPQGSVTSEQPGTACVTARLPRAIDLAVGSVRATLPGGAPWDDPFARTAIAGGIPPSPLLEERPGTIGALVRSARCRVAAWRGAGGGSGLLAWFAPGAARLWAGAERARGRGVGAALPLGTSVLGIAVREGEQASRSLEFGLESLDRSGRLSATLPLAPRADGQNARLEGAASRGIGVGRVTVRALVLGGEDLRRRRWRAGVESAWRPGSATLALAAAWEESAGRLEARLSQPMAAALALDLTARGGAGSSGRSGSLGVAGALSTSPGRVEIGMTAGQGLAASATIEVAGPGCRIRGVVLAPLAGAARRGTGRWRLSVERSGAG